MSDRGSLCFAALPLPDSRDRGGNEAGGLEARGGGGRPEPFCSSSFFHWLPEGWVTPPRHTNAHLYTHTQTPVPVQFKQLHKHTHTSTYTHTSLSRPVVPQVNFDLLHKHLQREPITETNAGKPWLISDTHTHSRTHMYITLD